MTIDEDILPCLPTYGALELWRERIVGSGRLLGSIARIPRGSSNALSRRSNVVTEVNILAQQPGQRPLITSATTPIDHRRHSKFDPNRPDKIEREVRVLGERTMQSKEETTGAPAFTLIIDTTI